MARLLGPDANSRLVYSVLSTRFLAVAGATATVYANAAGTTLANIATYDGTTTPGAVIIGSTLTVDANSLLPMFWFPDGIDTVWVQVGTGPVTAVNADYDARLDAVANATGPGVFNVQTYGAKGDGTTDDTAAIQAAINAAFTYAQANSGYAEVFIPPAVSYYSIRGALVQGGTTKGNSQLTIPIQPMASNKITLVFRGTRDGSGLPIWNQTVYQRSGSVLRSNVNGTNHGTFGEASVLGGPTPQQGYGSSVNTWNNVNVVIDGIEIVVPNTARGADTSGVDLRGCAEANIWTLGVFVDQPPPTITVGSGSGWAFGCALPNPANNAKNNIYSYSCEGFTYGLSLTEHCAAVNVLCVYCFTGIIVVGSFFNSSGAQHVAWVGNACVEACVNGVQWVGGGKAVINVLTVEGSFAGGMHVADTNGTGSGSVGLGGIINTIQVSDPTNVNVTYIDGKSGNAAAPTIPASATALRNPFWRDATIAITGGTVSAIAIDGVSQGLTSGMFRLPSGRKITLTYTVAPTWVWTLD